MLAWYDWILLATSVIIIVLCLLQGGKSEGASGAITGGILAIVYRENVKIAFCIVAGILLFAAGVYELVFGIRELIQQNKNREKKPVRKAKKKEPEPKKEEVKELDYTK